MTMDTAGTSQAADAPRRFIPKPGGARRHLAQTGRYSRFVSLMKILLPILALTLIVAVLAWPGVLDRSNRFQLTFSDLSTDDVALEMVNPRYLSMDRRNRPVSVTAESAYQAKGDANRVHLVQLLADFTAESETWISFTAAEGVYSPNQKRVRLTGPISAYSDQGYELQAAEAEINLEDGIAESNAAVTGQGPLGRFSAERMRIQQGGKHIILSGNVRLILHGHRGDLSP